MSMAIGPALARAAEANLGVPFRLHGRDPASGLDCLGLVAHAFRACGRAAAPEPPYTLRAGRAARFDGFARQCGLLSATGDPEPGDIVMLGTGPAQIHLAIISPGGAGLIHAHAGLRRVVEQPFPSPWPVLRHWRLQQGN